jgi:hypothetical protein
MRSRTFVGALLLVAVAACHADSPTEPPASAPLATGSWNGDTISVTVETSQATVLMATCHRGHMSRPIVNASGSFVADGTVEAIGGPPPVPAAVHMRWSGHVNGHILNLSGTYDDGRTIGPFVAFYGASPPVFPPCPA